MVAVWNVSTTPNNSLAIPYKIDPHSPCDPAALLLGVYPREMSAYVHRNICTGMFIAALLIKARIRNSPDACQQENVEIVTDLHNGIVSRNERKELTHTAWLNFRILLRGGSFIQESTKRMIAFRSSPRTGKTDLGWGLSTDWERGYQGIFWREGHILYLIWMVVYVYQCIHVKIYQSL